MNHFPALHVLTALLSLGAKIAYGDDKNAMLPGLIFHATPTDLQGRFAFLARADSKNRSVAQSAGAIYLYDVGSNLLRKVADCPHGLLIPSRTADLFCVLQPVNAPNARRPFLYCDSLKQSHTLELEKAPAATTLISHHAFFVIPQLAGEGYVLDFDFDTRRNKYFGQHNSSSWGRGRIGQLSQNVSATNGSETLHFKYYAPDAFTETPRLATGFYDMDVASGTITYSRLQDDPRLYYRAFNGEYVYFKGAESPLHGTELAVSPWDTHDIAARYDPEGRRTRTLHTFSHRSPFGGAAACTLDTLSPDGKYALVSYCTAKRRRAFYVVNVTSGKTSIFLEDKGVMGDPFEMSPLWWLP